MQLYPGKAFYRWFCAYWMVALHVQVSLAMDAARQELSEKRKVRRLGVPLHIPTDLRFREAHEAWKIGIEFSSKLYCKFESDLTNLTIQESLVLSVHEVSCVCAMCI
jgi:hypothetical protein